MPTEQDPQSVKNEPETKYVLSGQPAGWTAMAKEVRDVDEEKVQSCKDDVDTLMVFAGLFSAILSAFLVAAYPNLQPSPMAMMNYNLERIAIQTMSYNFTDGKLISTTISPNIPPPFQVSDEDIRVNVLWFASLILSLMAASFGMLVKQWLREFLAVENPSPLARLRIRHFREPQLRKWNVYEIVACLPLLLQLSLGLFFVGLCYFTASIHQSVGHTTLPLVVGWALCFFGATALPIFFPRCPYRTTFLKAAIAHFHRGLSSFAMQLKLKSAGSRCFSLANLFSITFWRRLPMKVSRAVAGTSSSIVAPVKWISLSIHSAIISILDYISSRKAQWRAVVLGLISFKQWHARYVTLYNTAVQTLQNFRGADERIVVDSSSSDIDILVSVDAIQANDELLGTTIAEALVYNRPRWIDTYFFLIEVLSHRIPTAPESHRFLSEWPFDDLRPLDGLRPQARESLLHILYDHIGEMDADHRLVYSEWLAPVKSAQPRPFKRDREWLCGLLLLTSALASSKTSKSGPVFLPSLVRDCLCQGLDYLYSNKYRSMIHLSNLELKSAGMVWKIVLQRLDVLADIWGLLDKDIVAGAEYFAFILQECAEMLPGHPQSFSWDSWNYTGDEYMFFALTAGATDFNGVFMKYLCTLISTELDPSRVGRFLGDPLKLASFENVFGCAARLFRAHFSMDPNTNRTRELPFWDALVLSAKHKSSASTLLHIWEATVHMENPGAIFNADYRFLRYIYAVRIDLRAQISEQELGNLSSAVSERLTMFAEDILQSLCLCYATVTIFLLIGARSAGVDSCREVFTSIMTSVQRLVTVDDPFHDSEISRANLAKQGTREKIVMVARACLTNMEYAGYRDGQQLDDIFLDTLTEILQRITTSTLEAS